LASKAANHRPPPGSEAEQQEKKVYVRSTFPLHRLEDILPVAESIENLNAGQPYPPIDIAVALGQSPGSTAFHAKLSSSFKYTLTTGSYKSDRIALTTLARSLVAPTSPAERATAIVTAVLAPEKFKNAYDYFRGKKLPDTQFLMNTIIREFEVPTEHAEQFVNVFRANLHFAGLLREAGGGLWVQHASSVTTAPATQSEEHEADAEDGTSEEITSEVLADTPADPMIPVFTEPTRPKAIFVGHGKKKQPLAELEQILNEYKLPNKVAQYEAHVGRPIPQKVADTMKECGAAILIFTADEELRDLEGNPVWRPSENVGHELGAASVLYDNRIIVFKERSVTLPSNYSGIGYIEFDGNDLAAKAVELFRELIAFGLVKITVGS
jgi:predicted nucleotide-binding protein